VERERLDVRKVDLELRECPDGALDHWKRVIVFCCMRSVYACEYVREYEYEYECEYMNVIRRAFFCELSVLLLSLSCNLLYNLYILLSCLSYE